MSQPPDPAVPPAPAYPGEPAYPGATMPAQPSTGPAAAPPPYPGVPPQYPVPTPAYPTAGPPYPASGPAHPAEATSPHPTPAPTYPSQSPDPAPPTYPATGPAHPAEGTGPHPTPAPTYPGQSAAPAPPAYPGPPGASAGAAHHVGAPTAPPPSPDAPPHAPDPSEPAPDDLDYRHRGGRVLVAEHQRGADVTAIGRLAVQLPGALVSLAVVGSIALGVFGTVMGWIVTVAWLFSGALVFHRPTELAFARHVLKLRLPTAEERARLEPVWREVTARAGIEAQTYELMVENSGELNAVAVAGHVVGVTTYALNKIPSSNLAAVLAHELGHHTGGHAWAGLLGYWYSLPGRIAWAVMRALARIAIAVSRVFSLAATGCVYFFLGMVVVAGFLGAWYITVPLVAAPYLLAYVGRRGELRANQQAAELGFAPRLAEVIHHFRTEEETAKAAAVAQGQKLQEPGTLARLLSTHPDHETRLSALEPYLRLRR
ncbi:M48 family metalloprotease [Streptomyces sp. NPDC001817]|uniref:M48 family metalloprotease n=1 Tax=Streptomyces sp. NPDC001817 TaxID=3154398 RepID=UPI00332DB950